MSKLNSIKQMLLSISLTPVTFLIMCLSISSLLYTIKVIEYEQETSIDFYRDNEAICINNAEKFLQAYYSQSKDYFYCVNLIAEHDIYSKFKENIIETGGKQVPLYLGTIDASKLDSPTFSYAVIISYSYNSEDAYHTVIANFKFNKDLKINHFSLTEI